MIVSIHQPNFLPWLGYYYKIMQSDAFVLLDDVQYTKNSYMNRSKIKTPTGEMWLTIPVSTSGQLGSAMNEVHINWRSLRMDKLLKQLEASYRRSTYFTEIYEQLTPILSQSYERLVDLNMGLLAWTFDYLGIRTKLYYSSHIPVEEASTERLVRLVKQLGGSSYLSGKGGMKYQEEHLFNDSGIELIYSDFDHPVYTQLWGDFVPGLSILDLLFNEGKLASEIIQEKSRRLHAT
ncbi:WbqC family protein [Paenibacillus sp. KN14-4R]|uniref:WbqC family protein n=1 Tax=Paenibacillus sp. KN14-4R TaxID=3445773 RepID=UPI003FA0CD22